MTWSANLVRFFLVVSILAIASIAAAGSNSEQVVFSGIGSGTFNDTETPVGFWIWCEADSSNKYLHECNGSMYFYNLNIVQGVEDPSASAFQELSEGIYQITVVDRATGGSIINCMLTNESSKHGPSNNVDITCTTPSGSTTVQHAVVNVTGP
jgi:hypothetical protein